MSSAYIMSLIRQKESERGQYENRKSEIIQAKNKLYNISDSHVSRINGKIDNLISSLTSGISGLTQADNLKRQISEEKEARVVSDKYLKLVEKYLDGEISECQKKIASINSNISTLWRNYYSELINEREARQKNMGI